MLAIILSLLALVAILFVTELLGRKGVLGPELKRKIFHILSGSFIAFWPWWMSWQSIEILGILMALGVIVNYRLDLFNFTKGIGRKSYGDVFLAIAISLAAHLASTKIEFTLAVLIVSLADGFAALVGKRYGANWRYSVFSQNKTVIGTMTFWLTSLCVCAVCLIFARKQIDFNGYIKLIIIMPPVLAALENFSLFGLDNLTVPLATIAMVNLLS